MSKSFKENCPTCGTLCSVEWKGLDLVENTGDETLASKQYTPQQPASQPQAISEGEIEKLAEGTYPFMAEAEFDSQYEGTNGTYESYCNRRTTSKKGYIKGAKAMLEMFKSRQGQEGSQLSGAGMKAAIAVIDIEISTLENISRTEFGEGKLSALRKLKTTLEQLEKYTESPALSVEQKRWTDEDVLRFCNEQRELCYKSFVLRQSILNAPAPPIPDNIK